MSETLQGYLQFSDSTTKERIGEPISLGQVYTGTEIPTAQYVPKGYTIAKPNLTPSYTLSEGDIQYALDNPEQSTWYGLPAGAWIIEIPLQVKQEEISLSYENEPNIINGIVEIDGTTNLQTTSLTAIKIGSNEIINLGEQNSPTANWHWDTRTASDGEYVLTLKGTDLHKETVFTSRKVLVRNSVSGLGLYNKGTVSNTLGSVNILNGNFIVSQNDIILHGRGIATEITRIYNSQMKTKSFLGWGWRLEIPTISLYSNGSVLITDGDGDTYQYTANSDGSYTRPKGTYNILSKSDNNIFTLKLKDNSKWEFDLTNHKVTHIDKNQNTIVYQYDNKEKLMSITDPTNRVTTFTYDEISGLLTQMKDYTGRTWVYAYDSNENLTKVTDPLQYSQSYTYDQEHQLVSCTDKNGSVTNFVYTENKLTTVLEPLNKKTSYIYETDNRTFTEIDANGNQTVYSFDTEGNILSETNALGYTSSFTYDENNNVLTSTDPLGDTRTFTYDVMGNKLTETDPLGNQTLSTYDENNNLVTKTDPLEQKTTFQYDERGNLLSDDKLTYTYNADGTVATTTDGNGKVTTSTYDEYGNFITSTDPLGNQSQATYDQLANKLTDTDPNGKVTTYTYDLLGRMLTATVGTETTTYSYDGNGNKLTTTDAIGGVTTWVYDQLNRLVSETNPANQTNATSYDLNGNVLTTTTPDGAITSHAYDPLDREIQVKKPDETFANYEYDIVNNRISMTDQIGTTTYQYDKAHNLVKQTDPNGELTTYGYDKNNQLISKIVSGNAYRYIYDGKGLLKSMVGANDLTTLFTYDDNQNRTNIKYPNGMTTKYGINAGNAVTNVVNAQADGNVISKFDYSFKNELIDGVVTMNGNKTFYQYDSHNRLIKTSDALRKASAEYAFDNLGNRISAIHTSVTGEKTTVTYTYDKNTNELKDIKTYVNFTAINTTRYTYDENGSTLTKTDTTGTTNYEYNSNRQMSKVTKPNGDVIEYIYNGDNQRIGKIINGVATNYVFDENKISKETDADGNTLVAYAYDEKGMPLSFTRNGLTYYYHFNGHGDVVNLTNSSGKVVNSYFYDAWGNLTEKTSDIDSIYTYGGQAGYIYDKETNLYFLQTRYYDASIGRFTTRDRFEGFDNRPASQNRYVYCENDPVNNVDPTGYLKFGKHWWNSTWFIGRAIDVALILIGIGTSVRSFSAAMKLIRANRRNITRTIEHQLVKHLGKGLIGVVVDAVDLIMAIVGSSLGEIIAEGLDKLDKKNDNYIFA